MKKLIKICLGLLIVMSLYSCERSVSVEKNMEKPYVVYEITQWDKYTCRYYLKTGTVYTNYINRSSVIDTIGKFNIGDPVYFTLNKK